MPDHLSSLESIPLVKNVSVLGVPLDLGKDSMGTDVGVSVLRSAGLIEMFGFLDIAVEDCGDIVCPTRDEAELGDKKVKYLESIVGVAEKTARAVEETLKKERVVFALGGDHSIALGTIAGASAATQGKLGVIWIDAHGDMMTHENTLSGNVHGMPSAVAFGVGHPELVNLHTQQRKVAPEDMLYIGLKDLDQAEIDLIRRNNLNVFSIFDILNKGWSPIFAAIVDLSSRVDRVWVSLDVDSIDSQFAPATPMPNTGGLTYREIVQLCRFIGRMCPLAGADLVEFAPALDEENKTAKLILELIAALCGGDYGWYQQYMLEEIQKQSARG